MNRYTLVNRTLAGAAFLISFLTYVVTLQPEVPFWDCGEFSAAAAWQQVPHPPGAPLWLLVARMFHMIPIGNPGWRLNLVSAVCSAFTVMLVYMIGVQLVERWRQRRSVAERTVDAPGGDGEISTSALLATLAGPFIGALAFTWSDTNWFNAVESEVYAAGNLLIALLIWLMMRWDRKAGAPGHERYLLMMAYVMGLAIGVHLLALLVFPAIAMVIYFKHYRPELKTFLGLMVITGIAFMVLVYKAPLNYIPNLLADVPVLGAILLAGLIGLVVWALREKNSIVYMATMSFLLIILGYTTYTQIMIRAQAHPPMNENEPDTFAELASYLGREQYGHAPNWPRRYKFEPLHQQYQNKYGEWFMPTGQRPDGSLIYDQINTAGELNFMMQYQIYHMYIRYFLWNFVGRVSDMQNAGVGFPSVSEQERQEFIAPTGFDDVFPISFFALPLLLGLFGAYYHYKRDWKMALVFTALFLFLGLLATLQQNQQQPQPRERDYFYVGSFMVFALWIGLGATGIADMIRRGKRDEEDGVIEAGDTTEDGKSGAVGGVLALCLLAVPLNMAYNGWTLHDRSGNYMPSDYAYNILQSCEKDAIVFTNGDNDTFPLWYMQDVEGVRRDVRVVNLSLGNTLWYVYQLKNERPWGALPVPISFDNARLRGKDGAEGMLGGGYETPAPITVPVSAEAMAAATGGQSNQAGTMTWTLTGEPAGGEDGRQYIRVQDKLVADIIKTNAWKRPVYFSSSVGPDAYAGLDDYFRREGMVYRILPVRQGGVQSLDAFNTDVMWKSMVQNASTSGEFHTTPNAGLRFRNMSDPGLFLMEDHRRLLPNYRTMYLGFAEHQLVRRNDSAAAIAVLDKMDEVIPSANFPLPYWLASGVAQLYAQAGAQAKAQAFAKRAIASVDMLGEGWRSDRYAQAYNPIQIKAQMQVLLGDYDAAQQTYARYGAEQPGDPNLRTQIEELRVQKYLVKNDTAGAARELEAIIAGYGNPTDAAGQNNLNAFRLRLLELRGQAPIAPSDNTQMNDSGGTPTRKR
jgi:MFS family permease